MSRWASAGGAWDKSHDGQNYGARGGGVDLYGLEDGDRRANVDNHFLFCFPFFKGYITGLPTGMSGRGLALRTDCVVVLVVAGIMYVNTPSLSWRLGRKL